MAEYIIKTAKKGSHLINSLTTYLLTTCIHAYMHTYTRIHMCFLNIQYYLQGMIGNPETGHPRNELWPLRINKGFLLRAFQPSQHNEEDGCDGKVLS